MPYRGHSLTIDHGWQEVAQTALDFVERFVPAKPSQPASIWTRGRAQRRVGLRYGRHVAEAMPNPLSDEQPLQLRDLAARFITSATYAAECRTDPPRPGAESPVPAL